MGRCCCLYIGPLINPIWMEIDQTTMALSHRITTAYGSYNCYLLLFKVASGVFNYQ